jgi:hypothetical protein
MNRSRVIALGLVAALMLGIAAIVPTAVRAAAPAPDAAAAAAELPALPDTAAFGATVDAAEFQEVVDITERITPHVYVGDDGLVHLADVSAAELGVTDEFLAAFKAAMHSSNQLIAKGAIRVDADLKVTPGRAIVRVGELKGFDAGPGMGTGPVAEPVAPAESVAAPEPGDEAPQWGAWNYGSGAMFYNSYNDYYSYRYNYYVLCNSMAAYVQQPCMSQSLMYLYTYNQNYFNNYCYNPYGTYFYVPYQNNCQYSNCYYQCPTYTMGYRPVYYWVRSYQYSNQCRCYQYNYGWQGFWARY